MFTVEEIDAMIWVCNRAHMLNGVVQSLNIPDNPHELHKLMGMVIRLEEEKKALLDEKKKLAKEMPEGT